MSLAYTNISNAKWNHSLVFYLVVLCYFRVRFFASLLFLVAVKNKIEKKTYAYTLTTVTQYILCKIMQHSILRVIFFILLSVSRCMWACTSIIFFTHSLIFGSYAHVTSQLSTVDFVYVHIIYIRCSPHTPQLNLGRFAYVLFVGFFILKINMHYVPLIMNVQQWIWEFFALYLDIIITYE